MLKRNDEVDVRGGSTLRNGIYNVAGQAIRGAVAIVTIPFLIRSLGLREYGVWSLAYALLALMTMSEAGMSVAATVFLSHDLAQDNPSAASDTVPIVLGGAALLGIIIGILLWVAGPQIVRTTLAFSAAERAEAGRTLQIGGLAVFVYIIQRTLVGIEQAFDRYAAISLLDASQSILGNVGFVIVAWFGGKAIAMMKWQLFAWAALLCAHLLFVSKLHRGKKLWTLRWSANKARKILHFSAATWISALGSAAFGQCDRLIVGGVLGAVPLGIYSAITNITSKINTFSGAAVQPLVPLVSRDIARNLSVESHIRQAVRLNALIAMEAGIFLFVFADLVLRVMVPGAATHQDIVGLQIAAAIYAAYSLNAPAYFTLFSLGAARINAFVVLVSGAASLGLIFWGARSLGLLGALAGNIGYLGTLLLIVLSTSTAGFALRRYLSLLALPCALFGGGCILSLVVDGHFVWRTIFFVTQAVLLLSWFMRRRDKWHWLDSKVGYPIPGH